MKANRKTLYIVGLALSFCMMTVMLLPAVSAQTGEVMPSSMADTPDGDTGDEALSDDPILDEPIIDETDIAPPTVVSAEALNSEEIEVMFNEAILIPEDEDIGQYFSIDEEFDPNISLEVLKVEVNSEDASIITLTTEKQMSGTHYNLIVSSDITDIAGNPIVSGVTDTASFVGSGVPKPEEMEEIKVPALPTPVVKEVTPPPPPADTTAPEDITQLVAKIKERVGAILKHYIELTWMLSVNTAGDLANQKVYTSLNEGLNYDAGVSVGLALNKHEVDNLVEGQKYTFKVTVLDQGGNESAGAITSIRYLPQTGAGIGALLLISSLAGASVIRRRKN